MKSFKDQLEALIDTRHIGATYAICALRSDPAYVLRCELVLHSFAIEAEWNMATDHHGLVVARGWIDISDLREALHENGLLTVDGRTYALANKSGGVASWSESHKDPGYGADWATLELAATGTSIYEVLGGFDTFRFIERRLPSFAPPFRDWTHLSQFLEHESALESNNSSSFLIKAPTFALIQDSNVTHERQLDVAVESYEDVRDLAVVVIGDDLGWPSQTSRGESWTPIGDSQFRTSISCKELRGPGTIQLLFRDERIHQVRFGVPPLAPRAHFVLDDEMKWLNGLLGGGAKGAKSDGFEVGVANLLALCGLSPVHYGYGSRDEFPDVVCAVSEKLLLVAECTAGPPPPSKLDDLVARAEHIRARVDPDINLLRVLFIARNEKDLSSDFLEDARENKSVAVLCREHIDQLVTMAVHGESLATMVNMLLVWISRRGRILM